MPITISKGLISLELKNITAVELKKLRDYFLQLSELQIHRFGPGKIILHFDRDKNLMEIEVQRTAWKKKKAAK